MDFATFLVQCLNALQYGLLLFLVASGLTLIFGIMGVINLAHGSFYMIGAYMAYALAPAVAATLGGGFFSTLAVGLVLAVLLGYALEWAFFSFLYEREHLQQVLMTYGLILVFEELRSILVGDDVHSVAPPEWLAGSIALGGLMSYPVYRLFISAVCLLLALGMWLVFAKTRLGMMIRLGEMESLGVTSSSSTGWCSLPARCWPAWWPRRCRRAWATRLGVDIKFLYVVVVIGVASVLDGRAGVVGVPLAATRVLICFVVVVIGGIRPDPRCAAGRLLIGLVDTFGKVVFPQAAGVLVYVMMALILLWKPDGLFKA